MARPIYAIVQVCDPSEPVGDVVRLLDPSYGFLAAWHVARNYRAINPTRIFVAVEYPHGGHEDQPPRRPPRRTVRA